MRVSPNGHLHLAIVVALFLALALAVAAPVAGTGAGERPESLRLASPGAALAEALGLQGGPLSTAITTDALRGGSDRAYTETVAPLLAAKLIPGPLLQMTGRLAGNDEGVAALAAPHVTFSVYQDGLSTSYSSYATTVGEALGEAGVTIGPGDIVYPAPGTPLTPGLNVYVAHATTVELVVGGEAETVFTHATTVGELIEERGIELQQKDRLMPRHAIGLYDGLTVTITTVREVTEFLDEPIPFKTVYRYEPGLESGREVVLEEGKNGHLRREHLVRRVNGEEVASEVVSERVTIPVDRVIGIGTYVPASSGESTMVAGGQEVTCARTLGVWATWYSASTSGGSGITRTGTGVYKGIIAVDPNVIPLGTQMYVPGYGFGIAADTGGGIKGNMIDLGYAEEDVKDWRTGPAEVCIIG